MPEHASAENLLARLRWLDRLRWLGAAALVGLALFVHFGLDLTLAWRALVVLAVLIAAYNLAFGLLLFRLQRRRRDTLSFGQLELLANLQIGLDLVFLTLALHFSGGATNPFIVSYLLHPIIASILLTRRSAYAQAGWATLLMAAMAICEAAWPSLHHPVGSYLPESLFRNPVVIGGQVLALAVSVHVSVYLAGAIARRLHQREQQLREARDALQASSGELRAANLELQDLEERRSRFLSLAAHQLQSPLAATEGCLAAAYDGYTADPAKQAELLGRARARIQGMLQIVRDLLTLAGTHDLVEPSRQGQIVLDDAVRRVVEQYRDFAASREIDLTFYPNGRGAVVRGDERALTNALGNLVSNAIKYSREGGHMKVLTRAAGTQAICEIIDDGIGIPQAERPNLMQDFFRASNARASGQEGTGLGLSIVREIVDKSGGRLSIESLENLGTCAVVTLPTVH